MNRSDLFWPALPEHIGFLSVVANTCDRHNRGEAAARMITAAFPQHSYSADDMDFVYSKLFDEAPHLLGPVGVRALAVEQCVQSLPRLALDPAVNRCLRCCGSLKLHRVRKVVLITVARGSRRVDLRAMICEQCNLVYEGSWQHSVGTKSAKMERRFVGKFSWFFHIEDG
eukprot:4287-Karenia_brevis.AAC.1